MGKLLVVLMALVPVQAFAEELVLNPVRLEASCRGGLGFYNYQLHDWSRGDYPMLLDERLSRAECEARAQQHNQAIQFARAQGRSVYVATEPAWFGLSKMTGFSILPNNQRR